MSRFRHPLDMERIADLEEQVAALREKLADMEAALAAEVEMLPGLGVHLSGTELRMLTFLARGGVRPAKALYEWLYPVDHPDAPKPKIVDVYVCKLRRKLAPLGIEIVTHWGKGFEIPPASLAILRKPANPDEVAA